MPDSPLLSDEGRRLMAEIGLRLSDPAVGARFLGFLRENPRLECVQWDDRAATYLQAWVDADPGLAGEMSRLTIRGQILTQYPLLPIHYRRTLRLIDEGLQFLMDNP